MAGYIHPETARRLEEERETRHSARLTIANRTEALRDILRENGALVAPTEQIDSRVLFVQDALTAVLDGGPYPDWLIAAIRPELRENLNG